MLEIRVHESNRSKISNKIVGKQFKKKVEELLDAKDTPNEIKEILINELKITKFKRYYEKLREFKLFRSIIKNLSKLILYVSNDVIHYKIKLLCRKIIITILKSN